MSTDQPVSTALTTGSTQLIAIDRLAIEDKVLVEAHDKLVEIRQVHAYVTFCHEKNRITDAQYKSLRYDLENGYCFLAKSRLTDFLAANEFKVESPALEVTVAQVEDQAA